MNKQLHIFVKIMLEFWTNPTVNTTYTISQNYTNMIVGEHGMQTFEIVVVVLFLLMVFGVFVPTIAHAFIFSTIGVSNCT